MDDPLLWDPDFEVGHALIDAHHRNLLTQCNLLAAQSLLADTADSVQAFDVAFGQLKSMLREHFESEALLLAGCGHEALEDHRLEGEEFDYLAGEIATTEHFDRQEVQRFISLWCLGHISGSAPAWRAMLVDDSVGKPPTLASQPQSEPSSPNA